ncbi:TonB-dependent receptor [Flavobacteriales bacterium]|nr:TonB-dependent receptor [Flavobacteriales bacterium]
MTDKVTLTAGQKALKINLDNTIYGSFVEIGAGQEVARHFFKVGSASGTIVKTMSAYDKDFSNAIYGKEKNERYVCKKRLENMLEKEYGLLEERLERKDHQNVRFFAFADTISTINFDKTIKGHGWIGLRFQLKSNQKPSDFIIHVHLNDQDAKLQQETIGVIGTNLLHACFFETDPQEILKSLYDNLSKDQFEINTVEVLGPAFNGTDNRLLSLMLVKERMTNAVIFTPDGMSQHPSDILHKKNILTIRGSFRPVTKVNIDMLEKGFINFAKNKKVKEKSIQILFEITLSNLKADGEVNNQDFLDRADILCSLGYTVMISNYKKYYKLIEYLSQFTNSRMGLILGVDSLVDMLEEKYYRNLNGGIMEAFGIILTRDIKFYLYPYKPNKETKLLNSKNIPIHPRVRDIYNYLQSNGRIEDLKFNPDILGIFSKEVLKRIKACEEGSWEDSVPDGISEIIKEKNLFGTTCSI